MNRASTNAPPTGLRRSLLLGGRIADTAIVGGGAVVLAALFWWPLFEGGGFVGGDVYSYYLPQKVVYAESLAAFELPLWNNRAGHGYPIVGESQTGPFYPANVVLYSLFSINTAYNINHLLHYVLAFVFTWLYARSLSISRLSSGSVHSSSTYGWFPPRSCWEWAIIGGAWMPAAFWCVEKFFATRRVRFALGLCGIIALQLLSGHFNLAFLTLSQLSLCPLHRSAVAVRQSRFAGRDALALAARGCHFSRGRSVRLWAGCAAAGSNVGAQAIESTRIARTGPQSRPRFDPRLVLVASGPPLVLVFAGN